MQTSPTHSKNEIHPKSPHGGHYLSKKMLAHEKSASPEKDQMGMTMNSDAHRRSWNDIEKDLDGKSQVGIPAIVPTGYMTLEQAQATNNTGLTGQMG